MITVKYRPYATGQAIELKADLDGPALRIVRGQGLSAISPGGDSVEVEGKSHHVESFVEEAETRAFVLTLAE